MFNLQNTKVFALMLMVLSLSTRVNYTPKNVIINWAYCFCSLLLSPRCSCIIWFIVGIFRPLHLDENTFFRTYEKLISNLMCRLLFTDSFLSILILCMNFASQLIDHATFSVVNWNSCSVNNSNVKRCFFFHWCWSVLHLHLTFYFCSLPLICCHSKRKKNHFNRFLIGLLIFVTIFR